MQTLPYLKNHDMYCSENLYKGFYAYHLSLYQISEKILDIEKFINKVENGGFWASAYLYSAPKAPRVDLIYFELIFNCLWKISYQFVRYLLKYSISYDSHYVGARIHKYNFYDSEFTKVVKEIWLVEGFDTIS